MWNLYILWKIKIEKCPIQWNWVKIKAKISPSHLPNSGRPAHSSFMKCSWRQQSTFFAFFAAVPPQLRPVKGERKISEVIAHAWLAHSYWSVMRKKKAWSIRGHDGSKVLLTCGSKLTPRKGPGKRIHATLWELLVKRNRNKKTLCLDIIVNNMKTRRI